MNSFRAARVGNLIQEKIGELIVGEKIKDPRVDSFLSVTRVTVSGDLSHADIFVSGYKSEASLAKGVKGLQNAAGFIQAELSKSMHIRNTPRLRFHEDTGVREGFKIMQKIDELSEKNSAD